VPTPAVRMLVLLLVCCLAHPRSASAAPQSILGQFLAASPAQRAALNQSGGLSVVTVDSDSATGAGVLFTLDGKPRVLTASHVLEGARSAKVSGLFSNLHPLAATAELDLPSDDLAVLSIDGDPASLSALAAIARSNFNACSEASCSPSTPSATLDVLAPRELIVSAQAGTPFFVRPQNHYVLGTKSADEYISGRYPFVWQVGAFTRSGVSGGAYYRNGQFAGLVTKVSHGLQSLTLAIPVEGIAPALKARAHPPSSWLAPGDTPRLEVKGAEGVIVQAFREGGDLGNGGDPKHAATNGEPRAWNLLLTGCFYCQGDIRRVIENPFLGANEAAPLLVNGAPVLALAGAHFQAATLARYTFLRAHGAAFSALPPGSPQFAGLLAARARAPYGLRFLQIWQKHPNQVLENARPMEGNFHDGVTVLLLDGLAGARGQPTNISPYPEIEGAAGGAAWIDFQYPEENFHFHVASDLSRIDLLAAGRTPGATLRRQAFTNPVKALYGDGQNGVRALFVYDEEDLTRLSALILETREKVYQLNLCHPNVGCGL
jgi:S1-C subfamily serine protease